MAQLCSDGAERYKGYAKWIGSVVKAMDDDTTQNAEQKKASKRIINQKFDEWDSEDYQKNKKVSEELQSKYNYDFYEAQTYREMMEASKYIARRMGYQFPGNNDSFYSMKIEEECRNNISKR